MFWSWQHQKRNNSARLPQLLKLTTSKTKQFCETSFSNGTLSAELTASYQCVLQFFHSACLKYCACHQKVVPGHTKLHLSRKIIFPKLKIWASKCNHLRKSAPGPPNSSDEHVSCTAPATENASLQILFTCPTPANVFGNATKPSRFAHFWQGAQSLALATRNDIWTSECAPKARCFFFWLFHFEMCFAPQWRALFRHLNFQKRSERELFLFFHLHMCFAPQWRALFSTSQPPKVVRVWGILYILTWKCTSRHIGAHFFDISTSKRVPTVFWCALYIFTWKCASRHNGVLLFISHLTTWLRPRRFSETLRSHKSLEKHSVSRSRLSYLFAHLHLLSSETFSFLIFFLLSFFFFLLSSVFCSALLCSALLFSSLLFSSLTFSDLLWLFPSLLFICPNCRKFGF